MMSAKTVLTETPATSSTPAPGSAPGATAVGGAPSDFQNLLAGVAPAATEPPVADALPNQSLMQLLSVKQQQLAAKLAATPGNAASAQLARPSHALKSGVAPDPLKIPGGIIGPVPEILDVEA